MFNDNYIIETKMVHYSLVYGNFSVDHTTLPMLAASAAACDVIAQSSSPNLSYQNS